MRDFLLYTRALLVGFLLLTWLFVLPPVCNAQGGRSPIVVTEETIRQAMIGAELTSQQAGGISRPMVERYVRLLEQGGTPPPIQVDGEMLVDGNHKYVAGRLYGKDPPIQKWSGGRPDRAVAWDKMPIDEVDWDPPKLPGGVKPSGSITTNVFAPQALTIVYAPIRNRLSPHPWQPFANSGAQPMDDQSLMVLADYEAQQTIYATEATLFGLAEAQLYQTFGRTMTGTAVSRGGKLLKPLVTNPFAWAALGTGVTGYLQAEMFYGYAKSPNYWLNRYAVPCDPLGTEGKRFSAIACHLRENDHKLPPIYFKPSLKHQSQRARYTEEKLKFLRFAKRHGVAPDSCSNCHAR